MNARGKFGEHERNVLDYVLEWLQGERCDFRHSTSLSARLRCCVFVTIFCLFGHVADEEVS